ncbi:hypothetical protein TRFO_32910 [Tritrichomonas foetus]|uniref:Myb-like DNA-binding domain containing protein n=1 Tax=Tritrichomonas foetus TaxID=1144522 RepID=A0A1J4JSA9_9EUKA|nr:hypothetical protein TRFO_32910 [Tritrichomonas foetus]|eukprot:OHT00412.1 hypothetical protein TRFO_32910 [Tritrichomonas foetus]
MMIDGFPTQGASGSINASINASMGGVQPLRHTIPHPITSTGQPILMAKVSPIKVKFTEQEDQLLIDLVNQYGAKDWIKISKLIETRNPRQCRERWKNYLNPNLRKEAWSQEEDNLLTEKVSEFGGKWNKIGKFFQNRSDNSIRNRWMLIARRRSKNQPIDKNQVSNISSLQISEKYPHSQCSMQSTCSEHLSFQCSVQNSAQSSAKISAQCSGQIRAPLVAPALNQCCIKVMPQINKGVVFSAPLPTPKIKIPSPYSPPVAENNPIEFEKENESCQDMNDVVMSAMTRTIVSSFDYLDIPQNEFDLFECYDQGNLWGDFNF